MALKGPFPPESFCDSMTVEWEGWSFRWQILDEQTSWFSCRIVCLDKQGDLLLHQKSQTWIPSRWMETLARNFRIWRFNYLPQLLIPPLKLLSNLSLLPCGTELRQSCFPITFSHDLEQTMNDEELQGVWPSDSSLACGIYTYTSSWPSVSMLHL